jgi:hypothetical protein
MGYSIKGGKRSMRRSRKRTNKRTKKGGKSVKRGGRVTFPLKYFKDITSNLSNVLNVNRNIPNVVVIKGGKRNRRKTRRRRR